ncbi:hypothetical protein ACFQ9X_01410 [Catenulispora yoronensis]
MTFEVEVPLRHRTVWPAFTDPEKTARAVPGLIVDAVHPVPPAEGSDGVAGDVVAGRLRLRVGAGPGGAVITYRGTGCIASADATKGTLDIAVDAAQARGDGALAGYLRITLTPAGDAGSGRWCPWCRSWNCPGARWSSRGRTGTRPSARWRRRGSRR